MGDSFQDKYKESKDLLVHLRRRLRFTRDLELQNEILHVISILESPLFSRLVSLEEALSRLELISRSKELNAEHFDFNKDTGELEFFTRNTSYRRPLSSNQAESFGKASKVQKGRGRWQQGGKAKDDFRQKKQTPGKGKKSAKRVEFRQDGSKEMEPVVDLSSNACILKQFDDSTILDPSRKGQTNPSATSHEVQKLDQLEKNLDEIIYVDDGRTERSGEVEEQVEKIVLTRIYPNQDLGFGVVEVKSRGGASAGFFVEGIKSEGLAAREGHLQEHDRIISLNNHVFDSSTTGNFISQVLNDPTNRSIVVCVVRNRRHLFHGGSTSSTSSSSSPAAAASVALPSASVSHFTSLNSQSESGSLPSNPIRANEVSPSLQRSTQHRLPSPVRVENLNRFSPQTTPTSSPLQSHSRSRPLVRKTSHDSVDMVLNTEWTQLEVISLVNDGTGLGFGIIGGKSTGVVVKTIVSGGVADRDGRLRSGDHILQICDVNVRGLGSEQVAAVLRQSGSHVRLMVARPVVDPSFSLKEGSEGDSLGTPGSLFSPIVPTQQLNQHIEQLNALLSAYPEMAELGAEGLLVDIDGQPSIVIANHASDNSGVTYHINHVGTSEESSSNSRLVVNQNNHFNRSITTTHVGDNFGLMEGNLIHTIHPPTSDETASSVSTTTTRTTTIDVLSTFATSPVEKTANTNNKSNKNQSHVFHELHETETKIPTFNNKQMNSYPLSTSQKPGVPELNTFEKTPTNLNTNLNTNVNTKVDTKVDTNTNTDINTKKTNMSSTISIGTITTSTTSSKMDTTLKTPSTLSPESQRKTSEKIAAISTDSKADVLGSKEVEYLEVELVKSNSGLGITVVGYSSDSPEEDISGIFVKGIAENSVAHVDNRLHPNDQIVEVDGKSLKGLTNQQSVEVLRCTGQKVMLKVARYNRGKKFEQLQRCSNIPINKALENFLESHKQIVIPVDRNKRASLQLLETFELMAHHGDEVLIKKWKTILGEGFDVIVANLMKLKEGGGLGMSLEGTVDVEDGVELRPHHYIRSIYPRGPIAVNGRLKVGDELLEVNGIEFYGLDRMLVVSTLKDLPQNVCVVAARPVKTNDASDVTPTAAVVTSLQLAPETPPKYKIKAKSEIVLVDLSTADESNSNRPLMASISKINGLGNLKNPEQVPERSRSKSLEPISKFGVWSDQVLIVELTKSDKGLGFSILDYQDPLNPDETIIVIGSLVPGGVAHSSGRIFPGDRLVFINDVSLYNATLDDAVAALKSTPRGKSLLGILKPHPVHCSDGDEQRHESEMTPLLRKDHKSETSSDHFISTRQSKSSESADKFHSVPFLSTGNSTQRNDFAADDLLRMPNSSDIEAAASGYRSCEASCVSHASTTSSSSSENEYVIGNGKVDQRIAAVNDENRIKKDLPNKIITKPSLLPKPKIHMKAAKTNGQVTRQQVDMIPNNSSLNTSTNVASTPSTNPSTNLSINQSINPSTNPSTKTNLLHSVVKEAVVSKGNMPLGLALETAPMLIKFGCVVRGVFGAVEKDGRISVGDLVISINGECLREVTNYQAKSILRRVALTGYEMSVTYVPSKDISQFVSRENIETANSRFRVK